MFAPESNTVALVTIFISLLSWGVWVPARHMCRTDLYGWAMLCIPTQLITSVIYAFTLGQISSNINEFNTDTFLETAADSFTTWRALIIFLGGFFNGIGDMFCAAGETVTRAGGLRPHTQ